MDKRVIKTKKSIRNALLELLNEMEFEKVKVKQICERANINRITFYAHYRDKYDLMNELYTILEENVREEFEKREKKNNPEGRYDTGFYNLLCSFMDVCQKQLTEYPKLLKNPELLVSYYHSSIRIIEEFEKRHTAKLEFKYDIDRLNAFFVMGFWGYIHIRKSGESVDDIKKDIANLISDIADSKIMKRI